MLLALTLLGCGSPEPACTCTLASGVTLACGRNACIDGQGYACDDGVPSASAIACALDGGGFDSGLPPSDAAIDAPATPTCTSPLITRTGTSATLNHPTAGSCEGDVAVTCANGGAPGSGHALRTTCASDEECRTYTMEVYVAPSSSDLTYSRVGSYEWARCVPRGATPISYTFHDGAWTSTSPRTCDGMDRVAPASIGELADSMQPENTTMDPNSTAIAVAGSPDGFIGRYACRAGQRCQMTGSDLACIDASAAPCTASRCDGSTLVACHGGFERPRVDCAAMGEICWTSTPDPTFLCGSNPEDVASCQPPGTVACFARTPATSCAADGQSYSYCDIDTCAMHVQQCDPDHVCYSGSCVARSAFCDPGTTPSSCSGNVASWCTAGAYRQSIDCATVGMTCTTVADATQVGGTRSACVGTTSGANPCPSRASAAYCDGNTSVQCCSGSFITPELPSHDGVCIPGQPVTIRCGGYHCQTMSFGAYCAP